VAALSFPNPWGRGQHAFSPLGFKALAHEFRLCYGRKALVAPSRAKRRSPTCGTSFLPDLRVNADFGKTASRFDAAGRRRECANLPIATGWQGCTKLKIQPAMRRSHCSISTLRLSGSAPPESHRPAGGRYAAGRRAECFLGRPPLILDETIARLKAYAQAGADLPVRTGHPYARTNQCGDRRHRTDAAQPADRLAKRLRCRTLLAGRCVGQRTAAHLARRRLAVHPGCQS